MSLVSIGATLSVFIAFSCLLWNSCFILLGEIVMDVK